MPAAGFGLAAITHHTRHLGGAFVLVLRSPGGTMLRRHEPLDPDGRGDTDLR